MRLGGAKMCGAVIAVGLCVTAGARAQEGAASFPAAGGTATEGERPAVATQPPVDAERAEDRRTAKPVERAPEGQAEPGGVEATATRLVARPGVTFYRVPGEDAEPVRLCSAPCLAELSGTQTLALGFEGGSPRVASGTVSTGPGWIVDGEYRSNSDTRLAGWLILGLGVPGGAASLAAGLGMAGNTEGEGSQDVGTAMAIGGAISLGTSLILGIVMALTGDDAAVYSRSEAR